MRDFALRPATQEDLPFLREMLYEAVHWPPEKGEKPPPEEVFSAPEMRRYLEGWERPGDAGFIAVAGGGERIGAAWRRLMTDREPGYGFVDERTPEVAVAVAPEARGRGVGSALVEALISSARLSGCEALSLSVDRDNRAVSLYRRLGFRTVEERESDALMKLDLKQSD